MKNGCYADHTYMIYDANGVLIEVHNAYAICDNGYHKWAILMEPSKHCEGDEYDFSEMLESLRKDIECVFGQAKQEFAILKYGSRFNSLELLDDIFLTCMAIHNQRKVIAGLDKPWLMKAPDEEDDLSQEPVSVFRRIAEHQLIFVSC